MGCIRTIASAALMGGKHQKIVLGHPLTVNTPYDVELMLIKCASQVLSFQRLQKYEFLWLTAENILLRRCNTLNLAILLLLPDEGEPHHDCIEVTQNIENVRANLTVIPRQLQT